MKLLLDTHALLWWLADDARLSAPARTAISDPAATVLISSASVWEIATKARLGKLSGVQRLLTDFDAVMAAEQFVVLPISAKHSLVAGQFLAPHRDPFDRMLAAQAIIEGALLVSNDQALLEFEARLLW
jgi:PIN domain nuclease of toxin-antitoxin system